MTSPAYMNIDNPGISPVSQKSASNLYEEEKVMTTNTNAPQDQLPWDIITRQQEGKEIGFLF
jgi:hypothetical protein